MKNWKNARNIKFFAAFLAFALCIQIFMPVTEVTGADTVSVRDVSNTQKNVSSGKVLVQNPAFDVSVSCGLDGYAAYDSTTQVRVTVKSAENFTGTIRMVPNVEHDYWMRHVAYEREISLAGNEEKTFTFYPSLGGESGKISISILDEKDREVYAWTGNVQLVYAGQNIIMGVLSDDSSALNYFDGLDISYRDASGVIIEQGTLKLLELTEDGFPENYLGLSILNYLIIDNFDTARLSDGQYEALKDWVQNGGILILGLGSNYQNVLHIFKDDFASGTVGGLKKKSVTWQISSGYFVDEASQKGDVESLEMTGTDLGETETDSVSLDDMDVLEFELDGGEEVTGLSGNQTAYQKKAGLGAVVALSYSMAMEPVSSFSENRNIAYSLLTASMSNINLTDNLYPVQNQFESSVGSISDVNDKTKRPSVSVLAVILFCYIVIAGPLLYLVLKKLNKREIIWAAIPVSAVVFTLVIFGFTYMYQIGNPVVNTFSVLELEENSQKELVSASVICPSAAEYELMIKEEYADLQFDAYYGNSGFFVLGSDDSDGFDFIIRDTDEGRKVILENDTVFHKTTFCLGRNGENGTGMMDLDLHYDTSGFEGTVTNNTVFDLENVFVYFENNYYRAGDLKKGESVTFQKEDTKSLLPGNGSFQTYDCETREEYLRYHVDSFMNDVFADYDEMSGGVWAIVPDYQSEICKNEEVQQNGCGVIFQNFHGTAYEDMEEAYYPDISQYLVDSSGDYDPSDNMMNVDTVYMTYEFDRDDHIESLINRNYIEESDLESQNTEYQDPSEYYARVYAYNPDTGDYDLIFADSNTLEGEELSRYLDGQTLKLRYETEFYYQAYIPVIAASGS